MGEIDQSEQKRFQRIGELLARAISRKAQRETVEAAQRKQPALPENADPIVVFLAQVGEATPKEIRERFGLSRATAYRRLEALVAMGHLTKHGNTRSIRYRLASVTVGTAA
ncbi:DNA-binding MarR family transcriptional regulator [Haloferula luteola]|uniref:DNA-binding MarR family transcriptional regulator n=1 Tax=Haloferula luteola TaxID=595692 RepID=A0A840VCS4_9BACT|nr:helix-turn-helix domain-containing protein [Haloferula luteola]MBB5350651.1 DNA-binding MarR family transcriptional regulator [Haloferula luteola]